jgi:hypothetical protein
MPEIAFARVILGLEACYVVEIEFFECNKKAWLHSSRHGPRSKCAPLPPHGGVSFSTSFLPFFLSSFELSPVCVLPGPRID